MTENPHQDAALNGLADGTIRMMWVRRLIVCCLLLASCASQTAPVAATRPATPDRLAPPPDPVLIHLPGIAGEMPIDRRLVKGLIKGGVAPRGEVVDWTRQYRGLLALGQVDHHKREAKMLADHITTIYRDDPRTRITLTAHSGGTGIAVWALELLPDDVKIDTLLLLASALSPGYDLSLAMSHTRQTISLYSELDDLVLGYGTRTMGTIDRVRSNSAGYVGFESKDPKLTQLPYNPAWIKIGNAGDHIGPMDDQFAAEVLAPLVLNGSAATVHVSSSPEKALSPR